MALSLLKSRFLQDIICRPWIPVLICMDRFCQFQSWMSSVSYHYSFWLLSCNILAPACFPLREMALFLSACIHKYNLPFLVSGLQLFFNWRAITLQYCVDFCHTPSWISYRYTYVPSLPSSTPSLPSRSSQTTGLSSLCLSGVSFSFCSRTFNNISFNAALLIVHFFQHFFG